MKLLREFTCAQLFSVQVLLTLDNRISNFRIQPIAPISMTTNGSFDASVDAKLYFWNDVTR